MPLNHISRIVSEATENDVMDLFLTDCRFTDSSGSDWQL